MKFRLLIPIAFCLGQQIAYASAQTSLAELSLSDAVDAAVAQARAGAKDSIPDNRSGSWLAAAPQLNVSYLDSNTALGTDETEVRLILPLKSNWLRRREAALRQMSGEIAEAYALKTRWFYSGLLRETLWSHRIATHKLASARQKLTLLRQLAQRQQDLADARVSSDLALLLVRQESVRAELDELEYSQRVDRWLQRYRTLTGLQQLPTMIVEPAASRGESYQQHPLLRLLDLDHQREKELLASTSRRAEPWNLSVDSKRLDSPNLSEDQFGVSLEVPLAFLARESQSYVSSSLQQSQAYWQARDELLEQLQAQRSKLENDAMLLRKKQQLLNESVNLSGALATRAAELRSASEISEDFALRRKLAAEDAQAAAALNLLLIEQNKAFLNQAIGHSL